MEARADVDALNTSSATAYVLAQVAAPRMSRNWMPRQTTAPQVDLPGNASRS